jgi:hypothetical protein
MHILLRLTAPHTTVPQGTAMMVEKKGQSVLPDKPETADANAEKMEPGNLNIEAQRQTAQVGTGILRNRAVI